MASFEAAGIKLYAVSYDDPLALREFAEKQRIPYPLLSDVGSRVIRDYGILNDQIEEGDAFVYGIPYPGVYVCDEAGVVVAKFFHDTYKKRDSPETLIDAAMGRHEGAPGWSENPDDVPGAANDDPEVRVTASIRGGRGTIRQGIIRTLIVRFSLTEGLHLYGEPVPDGMIPTTVVPTGPDGLVFDAPVYPPTRALRLPGIDTELPVWGENFEVRIPFYADGRLASETRPLDQDAVEIQLEVRYQACDDEACLLPKTEQLRLSVPLEVIDVPSLSMHTGHGQREGNYDGTPHLRRMLFRSIRRSPIGFLRFVWKSLKLEFAARKRRE